MHKAGGCSGASGRTVLAEGSPTKLAALLLALMLLLPPKRPSGGALPRGLNMKGAVPQLVPLSSTGVSCSAGSSGLRAGKASDSRARFASAGCTPLLVRLLGLAAAAGGTKGCCACCSSSCAAKWAAAAEEAVAAVLSAAAAAIGGEGARGRRGASSGVTGTGREPEAGNAGAGTALPGRQGGAPRSGLAAGGAAGGMEAAWGPGRCSTTSLMATSSHLSPWRGGREGEEWQGKERSLKLGKRCSELRTLLSPPS